jgi:hypothetical protein
VILGLADEGGIDDGRARLNGALKRLNPEKEVARLNPLPLLRKPYDALRTRL